VKGLRREVLWKGVKRLEKEKIMIGGIDSSGYKQIMLCRDGKPKCFQIARLVAMHFLENPHNYPTVDHINRIRTDNQVSNLRWANSFMQARNQTRVENAKHFTLSYRNHDYPSKWRVQYRIGKVKSRYFLTEKEARDFAHSLDRNLLEPVNKSRAK
jgi:hypothetical protein